MKRIILSALIIGIMSRASLAREVKNPYVSKNMETHTTEFLAFEIAKDFQNAISEYNTNRKNLKTLLSNIESQIYRSKFENNLKNKNELPEIIKSDEGYVIKNASSEIRFSIDLILKNQFYFNGKLYSLDPTSKKYKPALFSLYLNRMIDLLLTQSIAGEAFIADTESTRLLIAAIIALDGTFEKIGMLCMLSCKENISKINAKKLIAKISEHKKKCEKSLDDQKESFDQYNRTKDIDNILLLSIESDFEKTKNLLEKMSEVQKKVIDKTIVSSSFESGMTQKTCFAQIRSTYRMFITNANLATDQKAELDQQASDTCAAIGELKTCLSDVHAQSTMIYNSTKREYKEKVKQDPAKVPTIDGISK